MYFYPLFVHIKKHTYISLFPGILGQNWELQYNLLFVMISLTMTYLQIIPIIFLIIWSYVWGGIALWKSARFGQSNWFIVILVLNLVLNGRSFGILEIIYLFFFAKKKMTFAQIEDWVLRITHRSK